MKIRNSVALVTGANRGIGLAFTRALLGRGAGKVYGAARDPSTIDRDRCAIGSDGGGETCGSAGETDEVSCKPEAVGSDEVSSVLAAAVLIAGARGEVGEEQRNDDLVLRCGLHSAFGVHGEFGVFRCVGTGERGLNVAALAARQDDLSEVKVKRSCTREGAGWFGLCNSAYDE